MTAFLTGSMMRGLITQFYPDQIWLYILVPASVVFVAAVFFVMYQLVPAILENWFVESHPRGCRSEHNPEMRELERLWEAAPDVGPLPPPKKPKRG